MLVHKTFCTDILKPCDTLLGEGSCDTYVEDCLFCSVEPYTNTVATAYISTGIIFLIAFLGARWRIKQAKKRILQQITIEAANERT